MSIIKIKNKDGNIIDIPVLKGKDYILTEEDKINLANQVLSLITEAECIPLGSATNKLAQVIDRSVTEITAEDLAGVTEIGNYAFYNCDSLTSVMIPDSVTSIESYAFYKCASLTSVTMGNSVTSIGSDAFNGCNSLTSIRIPNSVTEIGSSAFSSCISLTNVIIPDSVTSIAANAFYICKGLTEVRIGKGINFMHSIVFSKCTALTDIYIDAPEDSISGAPWGATNATIHWNTPLPKKM